MAELELDARQVRNFRLQAHHLDAFYGRERVGGRALQPRARVRGG